MKSLFRRKKKVESFGAKGEALAADYLKQQGYRILKRNFKAGGGEIDLIVKKKEWIAFVEVKSRKGTAFGLPEEAVGETKKKKIMNVAEAFIQKYDDKIVQYRFDVISVLEEPSGNSQIIHLPDAFEKGEVF